MPLDVDQVAQDAIRTSEMPLARAPAIGCRMDVFSINEGKIILKWPEKMSPESYEDFQSWIELQLRKIKRSIVN